MLSKVICCRGVIKAYVCGKVLKPTLQQELFSLDKQFSLSYRGKIIALKEAKVIVLGFLDSLMKVQTISSIL